VWIGFFQGKENPQTQLLERRLNNDLSVLICPPVLQEIFQGVKEEKQYALLKDQLLSMDMLSYDSVEIALEAADIYRSCRKQRLTLRKLWIA